MELIVKHFKELTTQELFEIYKLRVSVFVVEQACPYQEVDDIDTKAYHLFLKDKDGIVAYSRVFKEEQVAIGRVIAAKRRCGYGTQIVKAAIEIAIEKFEAKQIYLEAQVYAKSLYEKLGFKQISDEFLEDGIPHIKMELKIK